MDKVAIFADVQNIYYTTKEQYGCHFNYSAFWATATSGRKVVKANAYAIDRGDKRQMQFQQVLSAIGFDIKLKPYIQRSDGSAKGDWDVGITLDMLEYAGKIDVLVLASGDGDFDLVVQKVKKEFNVAVEVYGVPNLTANSLIQAATRFFPIQGGLLLA